MASKTNVEARKEQKGRRVKHFDAKGHEIQRAQLSGIGKIKWGWLCEQCGRVKRASHT